MAVRFKRGQARGELSIIIHKFGVECALFKMYLMEHRDVQTFKNVQTEIMSHQ